MRWLGLDPAIGAFGWAVLERGGATPGIIDLGTWKTKVDQDAGKLADRARRLDDIGHRLLSLITEHQPRFVFIESVVFLGPGRNSFMSVSASSRVRGLVEGICLACDLALREVRPDQVKRAITGRRNASKEDVARRLHQLFPFPKVFDASLDATDALAVAVAGDAAGAYSIATPNIVRTSAELAEESDYF